jgi:hypothetical protein
MVIVLFEHRIRAGIDKAEWEQTFGRHVAHAQRKRTQFAAGSAIAASRADCLSPGPSPERYRYATTTAIARPAPASGIRRHRESD